MVVAYALGRYAQLSQTFVDAEISELRRTGHVVHVVATRRGDTDRSDDAHVTYLEAIDDDWPRIARAHLQRLIRRPVGYVRFLRAARALRSEMGRSHPELVRWWRLPGVARDLERAGVQHVHAHFAWAGAAVAACLAPLLGVRWSMTAHANDIFSRRRNLAWKVSTADLVVTVCDYNRRQLLREARPRRQIAVLTCGIALPEGDLTAADGGDVVTVGRLIPKKGIDVLVRAAGILRADGLALTVDVVGDGPEAPALHALAEAEGVAGQIRFHGALNHEAALRRIAGARVFCLPCRVAPDGDRDAMPTVIIEAMARGVPVVSTTEVGIPEMVDDTTGRLVAPDQPAALAAAIAEILADPQLARSLGTAGAARARASYSVQGQTARLAEHFRDLATS